MKLGLGVIENMMFTDEFYKYTIITWCTHYQTRSGLSPHRVVEMRTVAMLHKHAVARYCCV
jgi:hypothetical protein